MTFQFDGNQYDIRFIHEMVESPTTKHIVRRTLCSISKINPLIAKGKTRYQCIASGMITQHVNDKDVKSTARKIALGRAIDKFMAQTKYYNKTSASKIIRKRIWSAYFSECELKTFVNLREDIERMREIDERLVRYAQ